MIYLDEPLENIEFDDMKNYSKTKMVFNGLTMKMKW